ncbi:protein FAM53A-like [Lineus longissimus]|uniref:protein FAM53A-like n=1 Tax=Lineus longissimus TaxID=88925 RepID=UPI002B4F4FFA
MVDLITEKFRHQTLAESHLRIQAEPSHPFATSQPTLSGWSQKPENESAFKATTRKSWDATLSAESTSNAFSAFKATKVPQRSLETPTFGGVYRKKVPCHYCQSCEATQQTPPAAKKRRCRSLSIPNGSTWSNCRCHYYNSPNLWKPVALRPHLNNNKLLKNRNSPLACLRTSSGSLGAYHGGATSTSPGVGPRSSSEFSSPPDSPVPRPASVSSGYYDSSMSSLGAPWLDQTSPQHFRFNVFQTRSHSMEEQISQSSGQSVSMTAGSMPIMTEDIPSVPSSPRRQHIQRCRSQPCVLNERRGRMKRRREEDNRPKIDFLKMTETAYEFSKFRQPKPVNISRPQDIRSPNRTLASIFSEHEQIFGLKPITGSPLDNSIPGTVVVSPATSPTKEVCEEMDTTLVDMADSGCSDSGDPPEIVSFPSETGGDSCGCHDICTDEMFQIDVGNELDLDLIEND